MFVAKTNLSLPDIPNMIKHHIKLLALEKEASLVKQSGNGLFECKHLTMGIYKWLEDNIAPPGYDMKKIMIQTIRNGNFEPHIDGPSVTGLIRHYNLMYILETGGENVITRFYESPEYLIDKAKSLDYRLDYSEAKILEEHVFPKNTWNLMNNQIFHSVEGITNIRIGLSLSFYESEMPEFLVNLINQTVQN